MFVFIMCYSILLSSLLLEREIGPTVVDLCFDWVGGGKYNSGFLLIRRVGSEGWEGWAQDILG